MPPRVFNSLADAQAGIRGFKGRAHAAAARQEAEAARRASPEFQAETAARRAVLEEDRLRGVMIQAEDKLAGLQAKHAADKAKAERLHENSFTTGNITEEAGRLRLQIQHMPALIQRAESEIVAARDALARHRAGMVEAGFIAAPKPVPAEPEAPIVTTTKRKGARS